MVADQKQIGRSWQLFGCIGIEAFDIVGNVGVGSADVVIIGVGHGHNETLTFLPVDKGVELSSET